MQKRAARTVVLALLLVIGAGAASLTYDAWSRLDATLARERDVDARLDRMQAALAGLTAAQAAYVAPGQSRAEPLARAAAHLQGLREDAVALGLDGFAHSVRAVERIDARVREHMRAGQELMAADLLFSEGWNERESMAASLVELSGAERASAAAERRGLELQAAMLLGGWTLLWAVGLVALALGGTPQPHAKPPVATPEPAASQNAVVEARAAIEAAPIHPAVDLAEAAAVCTALSRVTTADALRDLLGRAASVLDASGLIVWLGAGEELFPATAHGYSPALLPRLGPIGRSADNATAAAWRDGELRVVPGDASANGAIVAPLFGPAGCAGVLAAEVRGGREADPAVRAVTVMIAAQLAAIVAAWPAASAPSPSAAPVVEVQDGPRAATA